MRRFVALWVRPSVMPDDLDARFVAGRPVVYALEKRASSTSRCWSTSAASGGAAAARSRRPAPSRPGVGVLFLQRRAGFFGQRVDRRTPEALRALASAAAADPAFDADIVPVSLFWGRAPGRERSWFRLLVAEGWDIGGRFRKVLSLLVNGRNLVLLFGEAMPLQPSLVETRGLPSEPAPAVAPAARAVPQPARREHRPGPVAPAHHRRAGAQDRGRARRRARRDAGEGHQPPRGAEGRARLCVRDRRELLALVRDADVRRARAGCGTASTTASSSPNFSSLESVAEGSEVVYVPCHRSHMDYLLMSYVVYHKGYAVPHIAAGINLNMPVIGSFLRRGGAFFLRRSFSGNALYSAVFMKYLGLMMARGHSIEYFIEGGRSRTGRLLQPKTGMLSMTVRSYLRDPTRPVVFVPVYFGYERLVEGRTYIGELSGRAEGEGERPRACSRRSRRCAAASARCTSASASRCRSIR